MADMAVDMPTTQYLGVPWWAVLIEGIAAVIIGLLLFASPGATMTVLVQILGWYWLITGIMGLVMMFVDTTMWGLKLFGGLLGVFAGILIIQNPLWATILAPTVFVFILGFDGVLIGGVDLIKAFQGAGWGMGILGIMSILIGLYLMFNPLGAAIALPWVLAVLALIGGIAAIAMSFQMKSTGEEAMSGRMTPRAA
jgi:uncharacterized membrane protein HdeD (DUF308 family)